MRKFLGEIPTLSVSTFFAYTDLKEHFFKPCLLMAEIEGHLF